MRVLDIPNRQMIFSHTKSTIFLAMIFGTAFVSRHLEKYSMVTTIILFCPMVFEKSPNMFISHYENGQGLKNENGGLSWVWLFMVKAL